MATITSVQATKAALTVSGLSTLASATYAPSNAYNVSTNKPVDVIVEIEAATGTTPAGNKQLVLFVVESLDGTNYQTGATGTTDEINATFLGTLPLPVITTTQRKSFSVLNALGYMPQYFKIIVKNDLGVALTSGVVYTAEISTVVI
jgi:hypothetical protein